MARPRTTATPAETAAASKRIIPTPLQKGVLSIPDQYWLLLSGGRGGGKSTALVLLCIRDVLRFGDGFVGALVRRDLAGLNKLQTEIETQMLAEPALKGSRYAVGAKEFRFSNGAILYLHYVADEAAFGRFQGSDLSHVYIDESGQVSDPAPILRMCSSMRTTRPDIQPRLVLTCNPNNVGSYWHYTHLISKMIPWQPRYVDLFRKEVVFVSSTLWDNPFLQNVEDYVNALKASCNFDPAKIESELYGRWGTQSGSFFHHVFDPEKLMLPSLPAGLPVKSPDFSPYNVFLALDWGTRRPSALVLAYRLPNAGYWGQRYIGANSIILVDEVYTMTRTPDGTPQWNEGKRDLTTSKLAALAIELCARNGIDINDIPRRQRIADAAIGAELGSVEGSLGKQLADFGAGFVAGPKAPRSTGWTLVSRYLEAAGDPSAPALYATPKVESFFATIPVLVRDEKNGEDLDSSGPDHLADAVRYMLTAMHDNRYRSIQPETSFRLW